MPNATFTADYSDFIDQTKKAEDELSGLDERAQRTRATLDKWLHSAPTDMHGVTTETAAASSEMGLMFGQAEKLAGILGVGFGIREVVRFGQEVLSAGANIERMTEQTGLSAEEVQRLNYVAGQSSTSIGSLVGAIQTLQQRLGDDSSGAAGAMKRLGLEADTFNKLGTYDQMIALSDALRQVTDRNERASLEAAVFGKAWKEIGPAIASNMKAIGDEAPIMGDKAVESLARAENALKRLHDQAIVFAAQPLVWGNEIDAWLLKYGLTTGYVADKTKDMTEVVKGLRPPTLAVAEALNTATLSGSALKHVEDELTDSAKASIAVNERMAAAAEREYEATIKRVHDLEGVVSHADAGLMNLSASEQKATQQLFETYLRGYDTVAKAEAALQDDIAKHTLSSTDYQIREIARRVQAEEAGFNGTLEQRVAFNAATEALAQRQTDSLIAKAKEVEAAERAAAEAMLTVVVGHAPDVPNAGAGRVSGNLAGTVVPPDILAAVAGMSSTSASLEVARMMKLRGLSFQEGGMVPQTGLIYAHKGEYVEPVGGGRGSGMTIIVNVTNPMATGEEIARAVSASTIQGMKNRGIRFPTGA